MLKRGVGLGWRHETARLLEVETSAFAFSEVVAESVPLTGPLPPSLGALRSRGLPIIPHGVSLSLGGGARPAARRLDRLAVLAERFEAPFVSEHVAFVRGGGFETEHLLPVLRTRESLEVLIDNVRIAQAHLPVPLVLENIAHIFEWPVAEVEIDEATFLRILLEETNAQLLLDVSNLYANARNFGWDVDAFLDALPLERIAYVHVAGGRTCGGFYRDTHADPLTKGPLDVLRRLLNRTGPLPVLLERDDRFGSRAALEAELDALRAIVRSAHCSDAEGALHVA